MVSHSSNRQRLVVLMPTARDKLYQEFGPKLIEALTHITLQELNVLRNHVGLPPRTVQQLINQINQSISEMKDYDWMKSGPQ